MSVSIAERIKELRAKDEANWARRAEIRQEIRALQKQCPHRKEDGTETFVSTKSKNVLVCSICGYPKLA